MAASPTKEFVGFQVEPTNQLLDPGPPPRPKRKLRCRTFLWIFLAFLGLGVGWIVFTLLRSFARGFKDPHADLYQDLTRPYRPQDVVRPLIDSNSSFDIIATVWLRTEQNPGADDIVQAHQEKWHSVEGGGYKKWTTGGIREKAIFSKTIFTGLTLKDKQLTTSVDFQVPTSIFKQKNLNNYDLRGSFVLVPTSTSVLDYVQSFSSWIPWEAGYPPVRSWTENPGLTLKDEVIDSYGTFTPLLTFYDIKSRCPPSESSPSNVDDTSELYDDDFEPDENAVIPPNVLKSRQRWTSTKGKPVLSAHPYIITRSFIGVADMTKLFNRLAYDNVHNRIRSLSCGRTGMVRGYRAHARWQDCSRSFVSNGNQEVKIKIARRTGKDDRFQTEWLYAPYLSNTWTAWGPRDLLPVPVNREVCQGQSDTNVTVPAVPDEEFVNVTWNIAFSGRTPARFQLLEGLDLRSHQHNMTDAAHKHLFEQELQESLDGLFGHRHRQTYHPRWKVLLGLVRDLMFYVSVVLDIFYWYTRSSTTGISISGTAIFAVATLLKLVMDAAAMKLHNEESVVELSFVWTLLTERTCRAILMLKAITRAEIVRWRKTWIPTIYFAPATHSERSSHRLDSRTTWKTKAMIYAVLTCFFTIIYKLDYYIVLPRGSIEVENQLVQFIYAFPECAILPAILLGILLQIVLNFRSKTFAGMYRTTARVEVVEVFFAILSRSPWIVGEAVLNAPVTYFDLFEFIAWCTLAVQSYKYPDVSDSDDEDSMK